MIFFILFISYYLIGGHMGSSLRKNLLVDYLKEQFPLVSYIIIVFLFLYISKNKVCWLQRVIYMLYLHKVI